MTFLKQQHRLIVLILLLISGLFSQYKPIDNKECKGYENLSDNILFYFFYHSISG